jgi:hypothetical protein
MPWRLAMSEFESPAGMPWPPRRLAMHVARGQCVTGSGPTIIRAGSRHGIVIAGRNALTRRSSESESRGGRSRSQY